MPTFMRTQVVPVTALAAAASLFWAMAAQAGYEVMSSTAPHYKAKQKLPGGTRVKVPAGKSLSLRDTVKGETYEIEGPYEGRVTDYRRKPPCAWWQILGCDKKANIGLGTRQ